jgi:hypothetical protein
MVKIIEKKLRQGLVARHQPLGFGVSRISKIEVSYL